MTKIFQLRFSNEKKKSIFQSKFLLNFKNGLIDRNSYIKLVNNDRLGPIIISDYLFYRKKSLNMGKISHFVSIMIEK